MDIIYIKISNQNKRLLKEVKKLLEERKKKVLKAIVEQYINTAEPVSSGNLVKELSCRSATIRNEMA